MIKDGVDQVIELVFIATKISGVCGLQMHLKAALMLHPGILAK